jgi:alpha-1,2-mannosyltransferase
MQGEPSNRPPWSIQSGSLFLLLLLPFLYCMGVLVCSFNSVLAFIRTPRSLLDDIDFLNFWSAAKLTLAGHVTDLFDLHLFHAAQERLIGHAFATRHIMSAGHVLVTDWLPYNWSYPPHLLPWIMGLGFLSYPWAFVVWLAITFALYALAVVSGRPKPWPLLLLLLVAPASLVNIALGHIGFLVAAFLVGGLRLLDKRPILAGILFGCLTVKPQLGLLVPIALFANKSWTTIAVAAITTGLLVAVTIALLGSDSWLLYWEKTRLIQRNILEGTILRSQFVTAFIMMRAVMAPVKVAYAVNALFAIYAVKCVIQAFSRNVAADRKSAVLLTAALLATPYGCDYDMTIVSAAIVSILAARSQPFSIWPEDGVLLLAWVVPLLLFFSSSRYAILFLSRQPFWCFFSGCK